MHRPRSKALFEKAVEVIPGGVNSPVRAFQAVGGTPFFASRAKGPFIEDVDGNRYIDYVCSWGPLILGHAPEEIIGAIHRAALEGTSFGFATAREVELAERVVAAVPSVDQVRFVNSGTEATMSALRLARGFTGRDRVLKFAGCYHGHADAFLVEAGSGVATLGISGSPGVPAGAANDTVIAPFNDLDACKEIFSKLGETIAAIIVEPVPCNMGLVPPADGFLEGLRSLCDDHGSLLIFDEVITGFRLGLGGAQELFGVRPDLTTFGKVIGGGLPVGAYGGQKKVMEQIAPVGPVYQAGTLSGNPLAMAAGIETLKQLERPGFFDELDATAETLEQGVSSLLAKHDQIARIDRLGSIFYIWFKSQQSAPARNYEDIKTTDTDLFKRFFTALLAKGVAIAPSAFEVGFLSAAHGSEEITATVAAMENALKCRVLTP